jgi:hypothetical protein
MLESVYSRVPAASHWDLFRSAERDHPALVASLAEAIRAYAADRDEVSSTVATRVLLSTWPGREEWNRRYSNGKDAAKLFGMVMWVALYDDAGLWRSETQVINGRRYRIYRRVKPADKGGRA